MKVVVTGGGGFLGGRILRFLLEKGHTVTNFARGDYPELKALGVRCIQGDLRVKKQVVDACAGADVVFHVAAKAGIWGDAKAFQDINVLGTANVIEACRAGGVPHLIYTSSPSVIHTGGDLNGVDESLPYPQHYPADYPRTKAEAEAMVRAANCDALQTVSLRPHLIWGPGDPHILPRLVAKSQSGKLRKIGSRDPLIDSVYVDNAADAHILAWERLLEGANIGGKVYFVTNGEPIGCWTLINLLLSAAGAPVVRRTVPLWVAQVAAALMESSYRLFGIKKEPPLTRFAVSELVTTHHFDIEAARRDLGYQPRISIQAGLKRLADHLSKV